MNNNNMTALVSCFARAYHAKNYQNKVFADFIAEKLLTKQEYLDISDNMKKGISFFNPSFSGTEEEALQWIVENQLAPTPLARSAFAESALENALTQGIKQYLVFASGYDSYAYRRSTSHQDCRVFELDRPLMIEDKLKRLRKSEIFYDNVYHIKCDFTDSNWEKVLVDCPAFDGESLCFCSLLGISYYLTKDDFATLLNKIAEIIPSNSLLVFDFPFASSNEKATKQIQLAKAANEEMQATYAAKEIETLLGINDFKLKLHLFPSQITMLYFSSFNQANPNSKMQAFPGVNYCLTVKE